MTQTTVHTNSLPDVFSSALTEIFERSQPGIVQVHVAGRGGGTGVVWHKDGQIITNHHVVHRDGAKVEVLFSDGRKLEARVLHRNPELDLAVLKVDGDELHPLPTGISSRLRVGEWVFAVGHPWGQRWVITAGIVSSISTSKVPEDQVARYIKSDVLLAPGNSGGPLLDAQGHVVGINAMIFGGDLSVSIPSDVVSNWLTSLTKRNVRLGIEVQQVELPSSAERSQQATGLLVVGVGGQQTDILVGDLLFEVAGKPVSDTTTLRHILNQHTDGQKLALHVLRGGTIVAVTTTPQIVESLAG